LLLKVQRWKIKNPHKVKEKDINIEIPVGGFASQGGTQVVPVAETAPVASAAKEVEQEVKS